MEIQDYFLNRLTGVLTEHIRTSCLEQAMGMCTDLRRQACMQHRGLTKPVYMLVHRHHPVLLHKLSVQITVLLFTYTRN